MANPGEITIVAIGPLTNIAAALNLGPRLAQVIAFRGAVSDSRFANHNYRIVGGDRLMWTGGSGLWPESPHAAAERFRAAIARTFRQLGEVTFEHAWSGTMGFSLHGMPQVGEVVPGLWLASAFGAHGINTSAMAGELIAGAITAHDDRWRLFLPYELVWAGGRLGRLVQRVGSWSRGRHEDWIASVARRREAIGRAEAARASLPHHGNLSPSVGKRRRGASSGGTRREAQDDARAGAEDVDVARRVRGRAGGFEPLDVRLRRGRPSRQADRRDDAVPEDEESREWAVHPRDARTRGDRSQPGERGCFFATNLAEFGHADQDGQRGKLSDPGNAQHEIKASCEIAVRA